MSDEVKRLKDEGNAFFAKKQYFRASELYSKAILLDDHNTVLYANRAACRIAMNQFMDAKDDARKATEIDPNYAKAWFRYGSALEALGQYIQCIGMYEKTLEVISKLPFNAAEATFKKQVEANLSYARRAANPPMVTREDLAVGPIGSNAEPWKVAERLLPEIARNNNRKSIAWVLASSNFVIARGTDKVMNGIERSEEGMQAQFGAIADLSNGLIFDWRVFRLHGPVFLTRVNEQAMCEGNHWDAWPPHIGPEELKKKALERLRNEGWERTRPALTLVVRAWIIIGFLKGKLEVNHTYAIEAFKNALNVINWGRQLWKDVPKEQRGTMFDITFRRGVWNLYIFSLMDNLYYDKNNMDLLETIYKEANAIIKDVDEDTYPYDEPEIGFPLAFYDCIKANALACKALYHKTISESKTLDKKTLKKHWMATMNFYIEAADALPEDDENHPWYLNCAYVYMEPLNVSTSRVMKILERIRLSVPKMMKIWGPSMHMRQEKNNRHRVQVYARLLKIEELGKELLAKKTITPNGPFDWSAVNRIGQIED